MNYNTTIITKDRNIKVREDYKCVKKMFNEHPVSVEVTEVYIKSKVDEVFKIQQIEKNRIICLNKDFINEIYPRDEY